MWMDEPTIKLNTHLEHIYWHRVITHDVAYSYSDDSRVYRAGSDERKRIHNLEKVMMDKGVAQSRIYEIWNAAVKTMFTAEGASNFHRGTREAVEA